MEAEFVPYKQALELKELGFEEPCFGYYYISDKKEVGLEMYIDVRNQDVYYTQALLYQQAFRWFREKYGYSSYIKEVTKDKYRFYIEKFDEKFYNSEILIYEEAELECLKKLIEIVKNK